MGKTPGHKTAIEYSEDGQSYDPVEGINSTSFSNDRESLEVTDFATAEAARERIMGLKDWSLSASGHYEGGGQQDAIRTMMDTGTEEDSVFIKILWDGTNGIEIEVIPSDYDVNSEYESTVEASFEFESTGTPTVV